VHLVGCTIRIYYDAQTYVKPNTSSLVSVVIKFTTLSLFGSDCFAKRRPCVVHYAVHGMRIQQLYTGSSHSSVVDSTLLGL